MNSAAGCIDRLASLLYYWPTAESMEVDMFSRRKRRFPASNVDVIEVVGARYELVGVSNDDIVVTIPRGTGGWSAWAVNAHEARGDGPRKLVIEAPVMPANSGGGHVISNSYIGGAVVQISSSSSGQGGRPLPVVRIEAPRGVRIEKV